LVTPFGLIHDEGRDGSGAGASPLQRASPDGYTLLLVAGAQTVNATLYDKLSFNFMRDIAPVASISRQTNVANPLVPAKTVADFIAYGTATASHSPPSRATPERS
jgi:tripartite-type tricarboxylate transporter receptor subunit TctC